MTRVVFKAREPNSYLFARFCNQILVPKSSPLASLVRDYLIFVGAVLTYVCGTKAVFGLWGALLLQGSPRLISSYNQVL